MAEPDPGRARSADDGLTDFKLYANIRIRRVFEPQLCRQAGGPPLIRIVSAHPEFRRDLGELLFPARTQIGFPLTSGMVKQADIGVTHLCVQLASEAVR